MQDNVHVSQNDDKAAPVETASGEQAELVEIRLLDKIETIQNKAVAR